MMECFVNKLSQITGQATSQHKNCMKCVQTDGSTTFTPSHALLLSLYFLDVTIPDVDLQWAPLPQLLMRRSSANGQKETMDEQNAVFKVVRVWF